MSDRKHTLGPWRLAAYLDSGNPNPGSIVSDNPHGWGNEEVAYVNWTGHDFHSEQMANAQLIAAAPELLDAVSWLIDQLQGDSGTGDSYWSEFPEYRAALAAYSKATGGAPTGGAS